jgi:hypothetical protein
MVHEHGNPVSLFSNLHWLSEHLHRFYLAFLLYFTQFDLFAWFDSPLNHGSCDDCAFSLNLEAMVDEIEKFLIGLPFWNRYLSQKHIFKFLVVVLGLLFCGKRHHDHILSELGLAEDFTQS